MVNDSAEVEDLVQEALVRVGKRWHRVRKMDEPLAYTRRVLINLIIDGGRSRNRRTAELGEFQRVDTGTFDGPDPSAERAVNAVDTRLDLIGALMTLSARQRAVLVLRYWQDLPEVEVARLLGCSVGTIKSTASRSLDQLRDRMVAQEDGGRLEAPAMKRRTGQ